MNRKTTTDEKIKALMREARFAGDDACVTLCERALLGDPYATAECAEMIDAASAMASAGVRLRRYPEYRDH